MVTRLSDRPIDQAKPALVDAIALKPKCCSARALPTSQGLGSAKHPVSCILRKIVRLSAAVTGIMFLIWLGNEIVRNGAR